LIRQPFLCQFIDDIREHPTRKPADFKSFLVKVKIIKSDERLSKKQVLIFTRKSDYESDLLGINLMTRGIDYLRFNLDDIPYQANVRYIISNDSAVSIAFNIDNQTIDISNISLVVLRDFDVYTLNSAGSELGDTFSFQQWSDAMRTIQSRLTCPWINSLDSTQRADDRLKQLSTAKDVGFSIPNTLITNDPTAAHDFYKINNGDIVAKALHHHRVEVKGKVYSMYTHRLAHTDVSKLENLVYAPCVLQQWLCKQSELRVTVVGDEVFATKIDFRTDSKRQDDMHRCSMTDLSKSTFKLPDATIEQCIKIVNSLGLEYGAIDFLVGENEELTFLEVNAVGDWYWIERETGQPITAAMVNLIQEKAS
jgi:glutathione synthase/RimK-type ligase-like ATP-grasp enzyme